MFLVASFDFGGSSDVALHACTADEGAAAAVYERLARAWAAHNARCYKAAEGAARLVELLRVDGGGFASDAGHTLFWGGGGAAAPGVTVLRTNNGSWDEGGDGELCGTI